MTALLDWLYPPVCALCEASLRRGRHLCGDCGDALPRLPKSHCRRCGQTFDGDFEPPAGCPNCLTMKPAFDFATAALRSSQESVNLIHQLKLLRRPELGADLAEILAEAFQQNTRLTSIEAPLLVPVPLHSKRLRERRFNQAEAIGNSLARQLELPIRKALKRVRDTERQATLSRKERLKNLQKAFELRIDPANLAGRNVILIDDVFTTGSTAQQCSKVLQTAQPESVVVLTLVRA